MTRPDFDPKRPETWGVVLNLDEVAAIYDRSREAIRHAFKPSSKTAQSLPAPFQRHPMRWRKADVVRHTRANDPILREVSA